MNERRIEVSVRADSTYDLKGVLAEIEHRHKYEMMKIRIWRKGFCITRKASI